MEYFTHVTILAGLAVLAVQQILKLKVVPVAFANRYPVPTNIILSIIASIVVVWRDIVNLPPDAWTDWVILVATISVVAAITYNNTLGRWEQLRSIEGEGKKG